MGDIEDEKGGASLYQRALAIYNEGSDEWCIPNRGTPAWAKLEAIRDSLTGNTVKPKAKRATPKKTTAKRAKPKRSVKVATATRTSRGEAPRRKQASDAPLREALANLSKKRNRVITIPRAIVARTDTQGEAGMDKQDAGLAKLEAKLDKAITTATDAAAIATATATATATASDAKLKKLTRKLKDATAATTAAATAVASTPVVATATAGDSERKLLKLANKLKLATDTAAAASIANNATADAKLSKLVADLRVANAQAAASASAADAKLIRLTAQLEQATRAALSTLPQTPERQSALSRVGQLAASITYYTATTVASGVGSIAGAVGRKAVEYAAAKVAPSVPALPPRDAINEIPEQNMARAKQETATPIKRPSGDAPRPPQPAQAEPARPQREAPPPPIPERQPPAIPPSPKRSAEVETVKPPSPKRSGKASPKQSGKTNARTAIPEGKQEARDIVPLIVLPDIVIKNKGFIDAARELAGFDIENMGRPLLNQRKKSALDGAFKQYKFNWKEASGKYHAERKSVSRADMNKLTKHADIADITLRAKQNIELFGKEGRNIRSRVEAWMSSPAVVGTPSGQSASEATEPEFEESAIIGSETEAPQSTPLESLDISSISSTPTSTPSRTSRTSRIDESRDIPDDIRARMEGIEVMGQGLHSETAMTPEQFVINQMRRAVYGDVDM